MDYLAQASGGIGSTTPSLFGSTSRLVTRSGFQFSVRHVEKEDAEGLVEFYADVTAEDLRFRFLTSAKHVSSVELALLSDVDHARSENFLAFDPVVGCILGSAMLTIY